MMPPPPLFTATPALPLLPLRHWIDARIMPYANMLYVFADSALTWLFLRHLMSCLLFERQAHNTPQKAALRCDRLHGDALRY